MDTEQIRAKALAIKNATNHLLGNMPAAMYPGGIANWYPGARCDAVYWQPEDDGYWVHVAKVDSQRLADYLRDELTRQGYEADVMTEW